MDRFCIKGSMRKNGKALLFGKGKKRRGKTG